MGFKNKKGWDVITYKDVQEADENTNNVTEEKPAFTVQQRKPRPLIWGDLSAKPYWVRNLFPVLLEAVFLICVFRLPSSYRLYCNFFFYLILFIFFLFTRNFTFSNFARNITSGKFFWKYVTITSVSFGLIYCLSLFLGEKVFSLNLGFYPLQISNSFTFIIFAITYLFLSPVAEEIFFRGNLINLESKRLTAITTVISVLLYAITHSFTLWGILISILWAIPLSFIFIKTRNLYVPLVAHVIVNVLVKIPIIILFFI